MLLSGWWCTGTLQEATNCTLGDGVDASDAAAAGERAQKAARAFEMVARVCAMEAEKGGKTLAFHLAEVKSQKTLLEFQGVRGRGRAAANCAPLLSAPLLSAPLLSAPLLTAPSPAPRTELQAFDMAYGTSLYGKPLVQTMALCIRKNEDGSLQVRVFISFVCSSILLFAHLFFCLRRRLRCRTSPTARGARARSRIPTYAREK